MGHCIISRPVPRDVILVGYEAILGAENVRGMWTMAKISAGWRGAGIDTFVRDFRPTEMIHALSVSRPWKPGRDEYYWCDSVDPEVFRLRKRTRGCWSVGNDLCVTRFHTRDRRKIFCLVGDCHAPKYWLGSLDARSISRLRTANISIGALGLRKCGRNFPKILIIQALNIHTRRSAQENILNNS